jgi:hypothetical protein
MSIVLDLDQIYSNGQASCTNRWNRCDFLDKEIFAQGAVRPQYWPGFSQCRDVPGLPTTTRWDGVISFQGHLMGWQGSTMTWSDINDFTNFIPVASTIADIALTLVDTLTQPEPGVTTGWVFVNESTSGMVPDMFVRIDYEPYYNFYEVMAVSLINGTTAETCGFFQQILPGRTGIIFTNLLAQGAAGSWASATTTPSVILPATSTTVGFLRVQNSDQALQIVGQSAQNSFAGTLTTGFTAPAVGQSVSLSLIANPGWAVGDYLSIGGDGSNDDASLGLDIYLVTGAVAGVSSYITNATSSTSSTSVTSTAASLPASLVVGSIMLGQSVVTIAGTSGAYTITLSGNADVTLSDSLAYYSSNPTITIQRQGIGTNQQFAYPAGTNAITQPYVQVSNSGVTAAPIPPSSNLIEAYALQLQLQDLTGIVPPGSAIIGGSQILSLNANEAGQLVNAGDRVNGPIWAMSTIGLYGLIMKERSFQLMQYVGAPSIFTIWPDFADEGLLGRNTWCKINDTTIYFFGHRAFYTYTTGVPQEIGMKQFLQVLTEIDLSKVQEAFMYHKEDRREVWFVYPAQGANFPPQRVFIYNYEQNTCTLDDYEDSNAPITAIGRQDYATALTWANWAGRWIDQIQSWGDLLASKANLTLMALYPSGVPGIYSHGQVYDRAGAAYQSIFETVAHDCGDEQAYKYLDLVQFSLQVKQVLTPRPFRLFVQAGTQENLDGTISWSTPQWVDCAGNANYVTKLNIKVAGRFIRIRFYTDQADTQWRVTTYSISGRIGNTY